MPMFVLCLSFSIVLDSKEVAQVFIRAVFAVVQLVTAFHQVDAVAAVAAEFVVPALERFI